MITPEQFQDRLRTQLCPGTLNSVEGAAELAAAFDQVSVDRMAFVVPGNEDAEPSTTGTIETRQRIRATMTVFFMVAASGDATGGKALNAAHLVREAIKTALIGWHPDGEPSPVQYGGSAVADFDPRAGFLAYAVNFTTTYYVRG